MVRLQFGAEGVTGEDERDVGVNSGPHPWAVGRKSLIKRRTEEYWQERRKNNNNIIIKKQEVIN